MQMSRLPRLRVPTTAGLELVPPTLMVSMGYPWAGAATVGAVLLTWVLQARIVVRSAQKRHEAVLSYAHAATNLGADPAGVIMALYAAGDADAAEPPPSRRALATEAERPASGRWPRLPPGG